MFIIQGIILNKKSQKPIAGASITIENSDNGASSDNEGRFNLEIKNLSKAKLVFTMIGFKDTSLVIDQTNYNQTIKVLLNPKAIKMDAVTVHSHKESNQSKAPSSLSLIHI